MSGLLSPNGILSGAKFTLRPSLALSYIGTRAVDVSRTLRRGIQGTELRNFRRGRHLYSAGRPSRWASAYILVGRVNNVLCTFCKQKMIVLADSEVSNVKVM